MAFGKNIEVARADVQFESNMGQFRSEMTEAQRVYERTTGTMSTEALRLATAQEQLNRAVDKYGPQSIQARRATVALRTEMERLQSSERGLARDSDRATREIDQQQRSLGRLSRGALAGSGAFRGLGRSLAFASASFLGGAGLVAGVRSALGAASDLHEQVTKTEAVFGSASAQVLRFANDALGQAKDQALDTASTIGALLHPVGVVGDQAANVSVKLTQLGTDLASFYNSSVADALTAIRSGLVGETEPLRRYGVQLSAARVQALALADSGKENAKQLTNQEKLLARVKIILHDTVQAQGDYARTINGTANQEREWQKNLRNTEALLGQTLQPAYNHLLHSINDYLGNAENQKRIQKDVNQAVTDGTKVVKGLADGLHLVKTVLQPVVAGLGGVENAAQLALIVGIVGKARRAALSFGLISAASGVTRTKVVADAAAMEAALDAATRPRTISVTGGGAAVGGAGRGLVGSVLGGPVGLGVAAIGASYFYNASKRDAAYAKWNSLTPQQQRAIVGNDPDALAALESLGYKIKPLVVTPGKGAAASPDSSVRGGARPARPRRTSGTGGAGGGPARGNGLTRLQGLTLAVQSAENTKGLQDDLEAGRNLLAFYERIASNTKLRGDKLYAARQDVLQQQGRVQSIEDQIAADRQQAAQESADKRKAAQEKLAAQHQKALKEAAAREKKIDDAIAAQAKSNVDRINKALGKAKSGPELLAELRAKQNAKTSTTQGGIDQAQLQGFLQGFMTQFNELLSSRSNLGGGFAQTAVLEQLTRETNARLAQIARPAPIRRPVDDARMA